MEKLRLLEGLKVLMFCKASVQTLDDLRDGFKKKTVSKEEAAKRVIDTYRAFENILVRSDKSQGVENVIGDLFSNDFYKNVTDVFRSIMANPNAIIILSNSQDLDEEESYSKNLFMVVSSNLISYINDLKNSLLNNMYLNVPYGVIQNFKNIEDSNLRKIKHSDSYPETYSKKFQDMNFEILNDLFKAKLNSLNKNNILESVRLITGGNTLESVGEIFNCNIDYRDTLIDFITKIAGIMADYNLFNELFKKHVAKIIEDSSYDVLTNVQKEAAGILLNIECNVMDQLVLEDNNVDVYSNAILVSREAYCIVLANSIDEETGEVKNYRYNVNVVDYIDDNSPIINKENIELLKEESLLAILGYMIIDLFTLIETVNQNYDNESYVNERVEKANNSLSLAVDIIYKNFTDSKDFTEDSNLYKILKNNFIIRYNLSEKVENIVLYRNTVSNEDIANLSKMISIFVQSLNN